MGYGVQNRGGLPSERVMEELAGLSDLVRPFLATGSVTVADAATSQFVVSSLGQGREGLLVAMAFDFESQDYVTSPVFLKYGSRDANGAVLPGDLVPGVGKMVVAVGALPTPFVMPFPIRIPVDKEIILEIKNNSGSPGDASGLLYGIDWSHEQNRDVRRALYERGIQMGGAPWPKGVFNR